MKGMDHPMLNQSHPILIAYGRLIMEYLFTIKVSLTDSVSYALCQPVHDVIILKSIAMKLTVYRIQDRLTRLL